MKTEVCRLDDLEDPGSRGFTVGEGEWPFQGFVVRRGDEVRAYRNSCPHAGHRLDWKPDAFLTRDGRYIICASHGATFEMHSGICIAGPCPGKSLRSLAVELRDGRVIVTVPAQSHSV